jgi:pimeloyl-ACP methyl ester carboxylesterase
MKKNFFPLGFFGVLFYLCSCHNSNTAKTQSEAGTEPELKSIFINSDSIHYVDMGKGDPVVFVHGTLGDYRTWEAQMDTFAKNYRVIAYSRRFAYPNKLMVNDSSDYTVIAHSKDLTEFLKALNLEAVHLVGHSYGAFIALKTTMDHPELVRSLTLGEPPVMSLLQNVPGGDTLINNWVTHAAIPAAEAFKNNDQNKAVSTFLFGAMGDSTYFSKLSQGHRENMMSNITELKGILSIQNAFPPVTCDDLKKIQTPILLLGGDRSPLILKLLINELNRCLTNKEKAILLNTNHGLETENPAEFNKIVLGFIDKH